MKRGVLLFLVLSTTLLLLLVSCRNTGSSASSDGGSSVYTVTFENRGGNDVPPQNVKSGGKASRPDNPQRSGHSFENWYSDAAFQTVYDFNQPVAGDMTLYAAWHHELKSVIEGGTVPAVLDTYGALVRAVLAPYTDGASIVAKYVTNAGQGNRDASSWEHAAGDIKTTVDGIADAAPNKIYLVLVASGTHTPPDTLAMKNHVAIVGGWNKWEQTGTSTISGGGTRRVFNNNGINRTALLYGVTIAGGNITGNGYGGGMFNTDASPTLSNVNFSGNKTRGNGYGGGGMANFNNSSPILSNVAFVGNVVDGGGSSGGGMYNENSSPTLINVVFFDNVAKFGGGMYNISTLATLINVTFFGNEALSIAGDGGGMYNYETEPTLIGVTYVNNMAKNRGGGMYNDNDDGGIPIIVNTLFWNNRGGSSQETAGQQIYMNNDDDGTAENMTISFSLVQHGITTTNATSDDDTADGLGIGGGTATVTITQDQRVDKGDPKLAAALADNGGFVQTIALLDNSAAANKGAYVKRSGATPPFTFYYSANDQNWFSNAVLSSSGPAPPADALDLTAADARGYARNDRPDIGAYEYGGTAP